LTADDGHGENMLSVASGMPRQCVLVWLPLVPMVVSLPALGETKIALLIGNQAYDPSVGVLKNPSAPPPRSFELTHAPHLVVRFQLIELHAAKQHR